LEGRGSKAVRGLCRMKTEKIHGSMTTSSRGERRGRTQGAKIKIEEIQLNVETTVEQAKSKRSGPREKKKLQKSSGNTTVKRPSWLK